MPAKQERPSDSLSALEAFKELSTQQVAEYIGVTHTKTVWSYLRDGKIPQPRYLKPHKPVWRFGELIDHTHALMKAYDAEPRGFAGDPELQEAKAAEKPSRTADKIRERLFGK